MTSKLAACVVVPHILAHIARQEHGIAATRPLAVATDMTDRATIMAVCPRATAFGIQPRMAVLTARQRCRALQVVCLAPEAVECTVAALEAALAQHSDVVIRRSVGCWLLELVALGRNYAKADAVAHHVQHAIARATGWPCAIGLGPQRVVALVAAQVSSAHPQYQPAVVVPGNETAFLAPLPVQLLPGVGSKTEVLLERLGIATIGDLAALSQGALIQLIGPRGRMLSQHARGSDTAEEQPDQLIFTSVWRWGRAPTADRRQILARVYRLTERVGRRVRAQGLAAGAITLRLRWVDGRQHQATQRFTVRCDLDRQLASGSRAALLQLLHERRLAVAEAAVSIGDLGPLQAQLWDDDIRQRRQQYALDQIKQRHGTSAILYAWLLRRRSTEETSV